MFRLFRHVTIKNIAIALLLAAFFVVIFIVSDRTQSVPFVYEKVPENIHVEEVRWRERIEKVGPAEAYLELVTAIQFLSPVEQHIPAHIFGGVLYEAEGLKGLQICNGKNLLRYGCFHEFFSRAIAEYGLSIVPYLEESCPEPQTAADIPVSCIHGLGHGLVAFLGYEPEDLSKALQQCNLLKKDDWGACIQGAFMEYYVRFFLASDGVEARSIEPDNPYGLCAKFNGLNAERCVGVLPAWWRVSLFSPLNDAAFVKEGDLCRALPGLLRAHTSACFRGIGYTAVMFKPEMRTVEHLCGLASSNDKEADDCMSYTNAIVQTQSDIIEIR